MPDIDVDQLDLALREGAPLVDVRETAEYVAGHVPGAVTIPMGQLPARSAELDPAVPVHVICESGGRSRAMCDLLTVLGFVAVNVAGGTSAWARSGRALDRGPA